MRAGWSYVGRRAVFALITVLIAISLNFVLFRLAPGDRTSALRCQGCTQEFKQQLRIDFGLDKSVPEQYVIYLNQTLRGDFGRSFVTEQPVISELWQPIKNTLPMILLGTIISIMLGVTTGVIAAWRRNTLADKATVWGGILFYSLPTQWLALMLILYLAGPLNLPTSDIADPYLAYSNAGAWAEFVDRLKHMILPAATIGLVLFGEYTLIVRSSMLEALGEDYILTARAKGLSNWEIITQHALRNSMLPIVTLVFLSLGFIFGGTILIESVFNYPGIGLQIYESVGNRDYPMLQGAFLLLTVVIILMNFLADLLYFKLDPRVTE
ncbi:MAG: ABC transporter permease [Thermoleophilia bacterium]|jgi:ABC-type dipeptide/oligopeptide/nickel transport system permease component|nr:ABC transporter permease [Thermoleophilia bacterium]MBJ7334258.1 ABC transporter permease [Thermoleophilia bacterium]